MIKTIYYTIVILIVTFSISYSQDSALAVNKKAKLHPNHNKLYPAGIENGDTVIYASFPTVRIHAKKTFKNPHDAQKYSKLVRNVKKVYPYAKTAGQLFAKYSEQLDTITSEKERKKYFNLVEEELKQKYKGELTKLTVSQGVILVKLVDRETSRTSFEIVKDLRGSFSAFFWQQLALLFDNNLKSKYDPYGADKEIEEIVESIENGEI